jgi:hypothetical protein
MRSLDGGAHGGGGNDMPGTMAAHATEQEVDDVFAAIAELPADTQAQVQRRLARVLADYRKNGQVDPVLEFVRSLLATAHLHRNPSYRESFEAARRDEDLKGKPSR